MRSRRARWAALAVLATAMLRASGPAAGAAPSLALVAEVLERSGVNRSLAQFAEQAEMGFEQHRDRFAPADYERARRALVQAYRAEALQRLVVETFRARHDERRLQELARAYRTPLFERLVAAETAAGSRTAVARIETFAATLGERPPSVERRVLVRRLYEATGGERAAPLVLAAVLRSHAAAMEHTRPPHQRTRADELDAALRDAELQGAIVMRNQALTAMLYAYAPFSDEELGRYLDFWRSDAGRWFADVVQEALVRAITRTTENAARDIVRALQRR